MCLPMLMSAQRPSTPVRSIAPRRVARSATAAERACSSSGWSVAVEADGYVYNCDVLDDPLMPLPLPPPPLTLHVGVRVAATELGGGRSSSRALVRVARASERRLRKVHTSASRSLSV